MAAVKTQFPPEVMKWFDIVREDKPAYRVSRDQKDMTAHVLKCFDTEDLYLDAVKFDRYMALIKSYVPFKLFPWQAFLICMHLCVYNRKTHRPRWPKLFAMLGRGAGKDGYIAIEALCLSSEINGIRHYNVDICATQEDQSKRPVKDLTEFFERPEVEKKIRKFYYWTKEIIQNRKTLSEIKGHTNNPKGRDGLRPGIVIFNEVHAFENYANIKVFKTGKGKVPEPREAYLTSNGEVRGAVLDDFLETAAEVNSGRKPDKGWLYFICRLDSEKEIDDEACWVKANPSLLYLPELMEETRDEYYEWKENPARNMDFPIKRMGLSKTSEEAAAAEWEDIAATERPLPDLSGRECTCGVDYMKTTDFLGINLHFNIAGERYDINHTWICTASKDLPKIKAPWKEWVAAGLVTVVDDVEIPPSLVSEYISQMQQKYRIKTVAIDSYRYTLLSKELNSIGYSKENKNLVLVKQTDILRVVPVIDHLFIKHLFVWGDNPPLRWAANNTKTIRYGRDTGADKGSFVYAKIDSERRKNDAFMALVASICVELDPQPWEYAAPSWLDVSF